MKKLKKEAKKEAKKETKLLNTEIEDEEVENADLENTEKSGEEPPPFPIFYLKTRGLNLRRPNPR
jgi:hypothetical protein